MALLIGVEIFFIVIKNVCLGLSCKDNHTSYVLLFYWLLPAGKIYYYYNMLYFALQASDSFYIF
jgi:uncharacterized membrane protein